MQRRVATLRQTQENPSQEAPHSTGDLSASALPLNRTMVNSDASRQPQPVRERVKWPKMNSNKEWQQLDEDLCNILECALVGTAEQKIATMTAIIYNVAKERFGVEERKTITPNARQPNRREKQMQSLRKELKILSKQFSNATEGEKEGIRELTAGLRERLRRLRRAERTRTQRKKRGAKRAQFIKDPYRFTKTLLGEARSGTLNSSKEEVEEALRSTHCDPQRYEHLSSHPKITRVPPPSSPLMTGEPTWREVEEVVKKARTASAPGPSGLPYKVYKKCPLLLRRLWKILRTIWAKGHIPTTWRVSEGCFVPKEKDSSVISQFRTISLLSVEAKIFLSVVAKRITTYMTENGYVNTAIQKGGIPGFSGCLEHTNILSHLIQEAKGSKGNLTVVWLDLANAYGSMPHSLIDKAMEHYHIPDKIRQMINSYLGSFNLRFQTAKFTTAWQPLEKGIVTGCTVSPILFIMGMNLLITAAAAEAKGPVTAAGSRQPPLRGFMDDLTITTTSHVQARWILKTLGALASWARMAFKPRKSRSMVIRRGKLTDAFELQVQGEKIPTIRENPIKCLGKWYDDTLGDRNNISGTARQADEWLRRIDKSGLPGKFKSWIYQHGLLPRLMWLLTVYQIPMTAVEGVERKVNKHLRRWLGIPPSFTAVGLYIRSGQLQLPFSSVVEEFKVAKCRVAMMLRDSKDEQVSKAGVTTRSGRKWAADTAVIQAESSLELRDIIGNVCNGRQGLGTSHFTQWRKAGIHQRREMVQAEVRRQEEEIRKAKAVELATQGTWTRWDLPNRRVTWTELWRLEPFRVSFLLRSVYDTLPSPVNLARWGLREDPLCKLCGKRGTLAHILAGCQTALAQGRYRWRHDKVLRVMADIFEQARRRPRPLKPQAPTVQFVRAGEHASSAKRARTNILQGAQGWEMSADLGKKLVFPPVVQTTLRPDIVIWSEQAKKIILVELTVPWEEGCEEAHERKSQKYQDLIMECREKGWQAWLFPVEVGCRGFPAQSAWSVLTKLGISGKERKSAVRRIGEAAERASCWLWFKREEGGWRPGADGQ